MTPIGFGVIAALAALTPQQGSSAPAFDTKAEVTAAAFDPARLFDGDGLDLVRITYLGDDYAWPVYAIAIRHGCVIGRPEPGCQTRRVARMVRAPVPSHGAERPRWRGAALVASITDKRVVDRDSLANALDEAGLDWVAADLGSCPGAMAALEPPADLNWIADKLTPQPPAAGEMIAMVLHADTLRVEFPNYLSKAVYQGYARRGSPAEWADRLAKAIEPCWKPAKATPPWRRTAPNRR